MREKNWTDKVTDEMKKFEKSIIKAMRVEEVVVVVEAMAMAMVGRETRIIHLQRMTKQRRRKSQLWNVTAAHERAGKAPKVQSR